MTRAWVVASGIALRVIAMLVLMMSGGGCDNDSLRILATPAAPGSGQGHAYVSWMERNQEGGATLMVQRFGPAQELLFAWTDVSIKPAQVRTALLPASLVN